MCLLRKYCFGPGRVLFDVLSGSATSTDSCTATQLSAKCKTAADHFSLCKDGGLSGLEESRKITNTTATESALPSTQYVAPTTFRFGLNYLNENVNICMPVFAMHGNHGTFPIALDAFLAPSNKVFSRNGPFARKLRRGVIDYLSLVGLVQMIPATLPTCLPSTFWRRHISSVFVLQCVK